MYLLVDVLEQTEHLPSILEGFAKIGVSGATVLESIGMGRVLWEAETEIPAMGIIRKVLEEGKPTNRTIFAVIEDKQTVAKAVAVIKSFCGELGDPGKGIVFVMPVEFAEGLTLSPHPA
ncbi:MAG: P-II family nitrogen regulator [Gemmatimonadota bacterium]